MNNLAKLAALSLLAAGWLPALRAQEAKAPGRTIQVTGSATVFVKPDAARVSFVVMNTEVDTKTAREQNDKYVKKIVDAYTALTSPSIEFNTVPAAVATILAGDLNPDGTPRIQGKQATTTFSVMVREKDPAKFRALVTKVADIAAENGATSLSEDPYGTTRILGFAKRFGAATPETVPGPRVEWLSENKAEARHQAIKQAVNEAMSNAQIAAGAAKVEVLTINVTAEDDQSLRLPTRLETPADTHRIPVRVTVQVSCRIVKE